MKIQYFGIIFFFFNCSLVSLERQTGLNKSLWSGDTLILGGISVSLLFLFGLVLKETVHKAPDPSSKSFEENGDSHKNEILPRSENSVLTNFESNAKQDSISETQTRLEPTGRVRNVSNLRTNPNAHASLVWKREVPAHPELILAHETFLKQLGSYLSSAEIYFLSGEVSLLLASRKGKIFHLPESPEENVLTEKSLRELQEGRISFSESFVLIPLSTGTAPFGYLKLLLNEWNLVNPKEFQSWKEEYEEQVSIQFESSDPETGFGNLHAFELDKLRADENILIFASIQTDSSHPYVLKWISLWTSKILRKTIRFYRIRKDRVAFFLHAEEWDAFSKNLKELIESLQNENHRVDLNLGVSILEETKEEWVSNARKALAASIEQGPNRYICL
ncbi:hypothetical protein EHQ05_11945 [Leptospira yasudae]|nr:hypothetical protein [Leptospira yasudae]TGK25605.1 hypothetical protein EHQ05_11945 [Leptospira yasudae]TGM02704.1 hypothetical protein EHQ86_16660 [Leptospira yasudae]